MNYLFISMSTNMLKKSYFFLLLLFSQFVQAYPAQSELFGLSESMVHIWVTYGNGVTGTGSGVVIKENHVATDCHVFADSKGVNVVKNFKKYVPISVYADWRRDLCILKFDDLPLPPVTMKDSEKLKYEDKVFALTFPNDSPIPLPSYGKIKGLHPFEDSNIIRTSAAFTVGSSGGALFDLNFNLIGITTFKSPGKRYGNFYCLPSEWIAKLLTKKPQINLVSDAPPFWSLPDNKKPFFMQVIMPMQKENWAEMARISKLWTQDEEDNSDAWFYLGFAQKKMNNLDFAKLFLTQAHRLNANHLDSLVELYEIAKKQNNTKETSRLIKLISEIDSDEITEILKI
ncbi:serine protease [Methylophilaceae bacterium]|nr:serine protease [Methylophilaceae bacterium]